MIDLGLLDSRIITHADHFEQVHFAMLFGFPDPADSKACCEVVHQVLAVALHGSTVPRRLQQDGDHHSAVGHRGEPLPGLEERRRRRLRRISLSFSIFLIIVVVSIVARHRKLRY